jgi:hypothetical protein
MPLLNSIELAKLPLHGTDSGTQLMASNFPRVSSIPVKPTGMQALVETWDAQYVDFGSVQRTARVQYAVRCLVRCLYAAVKGTCNVLVKVSLEVTH